MSSISRSFPKVMAITGVACWLMVWQQSVPACDLCGGPVPTLMEQFEKAEAVVGVSWSSARKPTRDEGGQTTYRIDTVLRDATGKLKVGSDVVIERYRRGKPENQFLLLATRGDGLEWGNPQDSTPALLNYLAGVPKSARGSNRLVYFLNFLESSDDEVAKDAYSELSNAPYAEIANLAPQLPREKLRKWVADPKTAQNRLALYGLMLGLCGREEDGAVLEKRILEPVTRNDFRMGIEGLVGGYLLLTGEKGLAKLEEAKLKDLEAPYSEVSAVMQAMRFLWSRVPDKVSKDRLRAAMRILLARPDMADLVITDLARWRDWSVQDQLAKLYGEGDYNLPSTRRAIIRFMIVSQRDRGDAKGEVPVHVKRGREYLDEIRKKDPKMVADVERFPIL